MAMSRISGVRLAKVWGVAVGLSWACVAFAQAPATAPAPNHTVAGESLAANPAKDTTTSDGTEPTVGQHGEQPELEATFW